VTVADVSGERGKTEKRGKHDREEVRVTPDRERKWRQEGAPHHRSMQPNRRNEKEGFGKGKNSLETKPDDRVKSENIENG